MATKIRGRQIETDDFIKSVRNADVDWTNDANTASQKAIADLVSDAADKHFVYEWATLESAVTVTHNLDKFPAVTIVDTAGNDIVGDVAYIDINTVTITFSAPTRGTAYFN